MKGNRSRRKFLKKFGGVPLAAGLGAGLSPEEASARSEKPREGTSLLDEYFDRFGGILGQFESREAVKIHRAAQEALRCIENGGKLYCGLLGHLFYRAGGEIAPDRIGNPVLFNLDIDRAGAGDFLVVMSPAAAKRAKDRGAFCVGFTSPYYLNEETPPLALEDEPAEVLRNPDNLMLSDICDITIRCHAPYDEGLLKSPLLGTPVIPATSQITAVLYWSLAGEIASGLAEKGLSPDIAGENR
jgi:uncharacterized phosphosugar-binding protein